MMATIVSLVTVIGALILATSSSQFRKLGGARMIRLVFIWAVVIGGLVIIIQLTGLRIRQ